MTGWLLDTNVLSELRRPKPERKVLAFIAAQPLEHLYVSVVTLAEIRFGIELVADANQQLSKLTDLHRRDKLVADAEQRRDSMGNHCRNEV